MFPVFRARLHQVSLRDTQEWVKMEHQDCHWAQPAATTRKHLRPMPLISAQKEDAWKQIKLATNISPFQSFILARKFHLFTWNIRTCFQLLLFYNTSRSLTASELLSIYKNNLYLPIDFISCSSCLLGMTLLQIDKHLLVSPWQRLLSKSTCMVCTPPKGHYVSQKEVINAFSMFHSLLKTECRA